MSGWVVCEEETDLALAQVRGYRRVERGRPEWVRPYARRWWIPHPDWVKGQQRWVTAGEAGWRREGAENWAKGQQAGRAAEAAEDVREGETDLPRWARTPENGEPLTAEERPGAEGVVGQGTMHERPVHGYARPNPERLARPPRKGGYARPEDHPFFKQHDFSEKNIVAAYDATTASHRGQGMRWYPDMARLAWVLGGGDAEAGAKQLSAYSPQAGWPLNMFNAARALAEGRPLQKGEGIFLPAHTSMSTAAFAGKHYDQVFNGPKTHAFAHLGEQGLDHPGDPIGAVVVDRHAVNVAGGGNLTDEEVGSAPIGKEPFYSYVADMYRNAARTISERDGEEISPSELQAITWLRQQELNEARTRAAAAAGEKKAKGAMGLYTAMKNHWARWEQYAREHGIRTELGSTALAPKPITAAEARGDSKPVSAAEFWDTATRGRDMIGSMLSNSSPPTGLTDNWDALVQQAWTAAQESWGGMTIDAHTGVPLSGNENLWAVTGKLPFGYRTIEIPETSTEAQFKRAMDRALKEFGPLLAASGYHLGIFHDDEKGTIEFDPVIIASSLEDANALGAYTGNIGGAYNFADGNGYFPPHIREEQPGPAQSSPSPSPGA